MGEKNKRSRTLRGKSWVFPRGKDAGEMGEAREFGWNTPGVQRDGTNSRLPFRGTRPPRKKKNMGIGRTHRAPLGVSGAGRGKCHAMKTDGEKKTGREGTTVGQIVNTGVSPRGLLWRKT